MTVLIALVAFLASLLTFFSGFGLGTLMLPVFALFFPLPTAVMMTAVVHLLNNLFKLALIYQHIDFSVLLRFGGPALLAALAGAWLLGQLAGLPVLHEWRGLAEHQVTVVGLTVGLLIVLFAIRELRGGGARSVGRKWAPVGGLLSGFLGGLSGHQGALRSTFLIQFGLSKHAFIGTGVAIACLVDLARLSVYWQAREQIVGDFPVAPVIWAVVAAFSGALLGRRLLEKITLTTVHRWVGGILAVAGLALMVGLI